MMQQLLRSARQRVPLSVKLRVLYHAHNALSVVPGSERIRLRAQPVADFWLVHERGHAEMSIAITAFERWIRFDRGITHQLSRLAKQYGVGKFLEIEPGDRIVDIGANVGEFSLYASGRGAKILAIEADKKTARILRVNVGHIEDVSVEVCPVWEEDTVLDFYSSPDDAESSIIAPTTTVRSVDRRQAHRLDTLVERWADDGPIKLIKCDAEGAEPEVLRGASQTLRRTEWIAFDVGPERGNDDTYDECLEIVRESGFEVVGERPTGVRRRKVLIARRT